MLKVQLEALDLLDHRVELEPLDEMEEMGQLGGLDLKVVPEVREQLVLQDPRVSLVRVVPRVHKVSPDLKDLLDTLVTLDLLDVLVHLDKLDGLVPRDVQEPLVDRVHKVLRVSLVSIETHHTFP